MAVSLIGGGIAYQETRKQKERNYDNKFANGYFTVITGRNNASNTYSIVYANDTKVKYFAVTSGYKSGIAQIYSANRTLQIYKEG